MAKIFRGVTPAWLIFTERGSDGGLDVHNPHILRRQINHASLFLICVFF